MDVDKEVEWRSIPGFPAYEISSEGKVRSLPRIVRWGTSRRTIPGGPYKFHKGRKQQYFMFSAFNRDTQKQASFYVHRLMAEVFLGPRPDGMIIRHLNGNPQDNRIENLKYGTRRENAEDAMRHGALAVGRKAGGKLNNEIVIEIRRAIRRDGETYNDIARRFGMSRSSIKQIALGLSWRFVPDPDKQLPPGTLSELMWCG